MLLGFIKPGDTVLDMGANIGTHTVPFANAVGSSGTVWVFEPQRLFFHLIKIEAEGMEPEVIQGARATIAAHRPVLFVENNTIDKASPTIAAVLDAGYRAWWHLAFYYNKRNFFGNAENLFTQFQPEANLLCLPPDVEPAFPGLIKCTGTSDDWQQAYERTKAAGGALP